MAIQIQMRRDTYANWNTNDPTLAQGEWGLETDTNKFKIGTGSAAWSALGYSSLPSNVLPLAGGAMTGAITTNSTFDGVDIAVRDAILTSTTTTAGAALPKAGGAMTGAITTNSTFDGVDIATRDAILTSTTTTAAAALPKAGGAMTGAITTNSTFDGVDIAVRDAILTSTTTTATAALPATGGTLAGVTLSGTVVGADQIISAPIIKDYSETVYVGGDTGSTETLDETNGNVQSWTLDASCTFTMPSGSGLKPGTSMTLILTQDGASRTGTFTGVKWAGGTAVTLSTGDDDVDVLTFTTFNGGSSPVWYGFSAGLDMS